MTEVRKKAPTFPLRLPPNIRSRIERLAASEGISLNQFIALTLAEKIGASAERSFFAEPKAGADFDDLRTFLNRAGGDVPRAGDEIVAG
jgi:hypothetical protein